MANTILTNMVTNDSPSKIRGGKGALTDTMTQHVANMTQMKAKRRELRSNGTPAEATLWNYLKGKQIRGLQFRRQYSIGSHILDFYCPALRLAIELDGEYHYHHDMPKNDWERDIELLQTYNIKTLRFENRVVFEHPQSIINKILQVIEESTGLKNDSGDSRGSTPPNPL